MRAIELTEDRLTELTKFTWNSLSVNAFHLYLPVDRKIELALNYTYFHSHWLTLNQNLSSICKNVLNVEVRNWEDIIKYFQTVDQPKWTNSQSKLDVPASVLGPIPSNCVHRANCSVDCYRHLHWQVQRWKLNYPRARWRPIRAKPSHVSLLPPPPCLPLLWIERCFTYVLRGWI